MEDGGASVLPGDVAVTPDVQETESQESPVLPSLIGPSHVHSVSVGGGGTGPHHNLRPQGKDRWAH